MKYDISKVSPRPWSIHGPIILSDMSCVDRQTSRGNPDAEAQWARDAVHIVHCVNHHEALVEALEKMCVLVESVADQQAIPDDSWRWSKEWEETSVLLEKVMQHDNK